MILPLIPTPRGENFVPKGFKKGPKPEIIKAKPNLRIVMPIDVLTFMQK